ncbi:hypothetical protein ACFL0A_01225 [Patescibacteria group bacterium]
MPIEIIPKSTKKSPFWFDALFYFSIALLLISLSSFFILNHLEKKASEEFQDLENLLAKEKTSEEIATEKDVFKYQRKIDDFSVLIDLHQSPLNFFSILENNCHPKVQFTNFALDSKLLTATLYGKTESFNTLGQQISIFEEESLIKDVVLSQLSIGKKGGTDFVLNFSLNPETFIPVENFEKEEQ